MSALNKIHNEYADTIGADLYRDIPKAVFAALAVSGLTSGGDFLSDARTRVIDEWRVLHQAGIVPQAPPARYVAEVPADEERGR